MSFQLLNEAYVAYQERKAATGAPDIDDVTKHGAETLNAGDVPGVLSGTDLTFGDTTRFAAAMIEQIIEVFGTRNSNIAAVFVMNMGGMAEELVSMLGTATQEGLMVGIEYGRRLEREDRNA